MLCIWWEQNGVIYYELLKLSETITSERYRLQLIRLRRALIEKRPEWENRHAKVILQHDIELLIELNTICIKLNTLHKLLSNYVYVYILNLRIIYNYIFIIINLSFIYPKIAFEGTTLY